MPVQRGSAFMSDAVLTGIAGGIGTITLNKPWKLNAWDTPMRAEITAQLNDWNRDPAVRAVIMTGAGERAFCHPASPHDPEHGSAASVHSRCVASAAGAGRRDRDQRLSGH